ALRDQSPQDRKRLRIDGNPTLTEENAQSGRRNGKCRLLRLFVLVLDPMSEPQRDRQIEFARESRVSKQSGNAFSQHDEELNERRIKNPPGPGDLYRDLLDLAGPGEQDRAELVR